MSWLWWVAFAWAADTLEFEDAHVVWDPLTASQRRAVRAYERTSTAGARARLQRLVVRSGQGCRDRIAQALTVRESERPQDHRWCARAVVLTVALEEGEEPALLDYAARRMLAGHREGLSDVVPWAVGRPLPAWDDHLAALETLTGRVRVAEHALALVREAKARGRSGVSAADERATASIVGEALADAGRFEAQIELYQSLGMDVPAQTWWDSGRPEAAVSALRGSLRDSDSRGWALLAEWELAQGSVAGARDALGRAERGMQGTTPQEARQLARVARSLGEIERAEGWLQAAIEAGDRRARLDLAELRLLAGDAVGATPLVEAGWTSAELDERSRVWATLLRARAAIGTGEIERAERLLGAPGFQSVALPHRVAAGVQRARAGLMASPTGEDAALAALDAALHLEDVRDGEQLLRDSVAARRQRALERAATTHRAVSAHLQHRPTSPAAAALALRTIVRRKGRLIDAEYDTLQLVRTNADEDGLAIIDALLDATSRQAALHGRDVSPEGQRAWEDQRAAVDAEVAALRDALAERSGQFAKVALPPTLEEVAERVPTAGLLVEIVVYQPWDLERDALEAPRYAVYTLDAAGRVSGADLGPIGPIDALVRRARAALQQGSDVDAVREELRASVFGPIASTLSVAEHVVVAADGVLGLAPLDWVLGRGIEPERTASYVTSGRDLLQLGLWQGKESAPAVVYDVDFGGAGDWAPLPGAAAEGAAILREVPSARSLTGSEASVSAVTALVRPAFLHIASHGFFLSDTRPVTVSIPVRGIEAVAAQPPEILPETWEGPSQHPALRSGIVLALDGTLTAAEMSNLDLRSTRVVVLSACDTAVGEIRNGDGVHGLRRALVLAGSHAQLLSLWKVDDDATQALMAEFYRQMSSGSPAHLALARARDAVRSVPRWRHPMHWAAFTLSGKWDVRFH